jgi:uncharacterized protein (DUF58 family)
METAELLKKVRTIELKTRHLTDQMFSGDYQSAFKGRGMSFSEVRDYQYGDDVRNIDWNVTARMGYPHVKVFEEERELTVMLMVDISPSTFTGRGQVQHELLAELAAVMAFSAQKNNDKVGLLLFSEDVELYLPPAKGKKHVLRIIREILARRASGKGTRIKRALEYMNNLMHKRSIVFLFSDFFSPSYETILQLTGRRHDMIGVYPRNPIEHQPPQRGIFRFRNRETGDIQAYDMGSEAHRMAWINYFETHAQETQQLFRKNSCELLSFFMGDSYIPLLHQFFNRHVR